MFSTARFFVLMVGIAVAASVSAQTTRPKLPQTGQSTQPSNEVFDNTNFPGDDYDSLRVPEPSQCEYYCGRNPKCLSWTWVKPGVQGPQAVCWLKTKMPTPVKDTCCVSGRIGRPLSSGTTINRDFLSTAEQLKQLWARVDSLEAELEAERALHVHYHDVKTWDYSTKNPSPPNPSACKEECEKFKDCKQWTFYADPTKFNHTWCRIKMSSVAWHRNSCKRDEMRGPWETSYVCSYGLMR